MRIVGLTGGIACGKSTVSAMLAGLGVPIVDADQIAREVVAPGSPAREDLVRQFGPDILSADGTIDRARLATIAFASREARQRIEAIVHPAIRLRSEARLAEHARAGHPVAVYDAALIVESGRADTLDGLIVVALPEELQLDRLCRRDGLQRDAALLRIRAQMPLAEKVARADWVIDNSGALAETARRVEDVWRRVKERFET